MTLLTFEDLPLGTAVYRKYALRGVVFPVGGAISNLPPPHSGSQLLHMYQAEFAAAPMVLQFLAPQYHVQFYAGSQETSVLTGTAIAYDNTGTLLVQDGPKPVAAAACSTVFDLRTKKPATIDRVELAIEAPTAWGAPLADIALDDVLFEGDPPPALPSTPPIVSLTTPLPGAAVAQSTIVAVGTVTGDGLPATGLLSLDGPRPPHDLSPPLLASLQLEGTGTSRTFSQSVPARLGDQDLTVTVENSGGLDGSATVRFTNLPQQIRDRYASEGGAGPAGLGALAWATQTTACAIAVFRDGALTFDGTDTRVIRGNIFLKWSAWANVRTASGLATWEDFCPTTDEQHVAFHARAQNFTGGRIYATNDGTKYVPKVFRDAMDVLGGEEAVGVPSGDPQRSVTANTWLFQRFGRPGVLDSTLEIKGSPPRLWIQRIGGDLSTLTKADLPPGANTATVVEDFPCAGNEGPCTVQRASSEARIPAATAASLCQYTTFPWGPREWEPLIGDYVATSVFGWVLDSHLAGQDLATTHQFNIDWGGSLTSDWNVDIAPIDPYGGILARNNKLEVEFEYETAAYFMDTYNAYPAPGDLYCAIGRWIIDCGHSDYSSEIHPPFATALIRTEEASDGAGPTTVARIWVNGYFPGWPIEVVLHPPPRPAPNAFMVVDHPPPTAGLGVNTLDSSDPRWSDSDFFSFVRAQFSATERAVAVGYGGMMHFEPGRGYYGTWRLHWTLETAYQVEPLGATWWP